MFPTGWGAVGAGVCVGGAGLVGTVGDGVTPIVGFASKLNPMATSVMTDLPLSS